jgi:hypothetical protein
MRQIVVSTTTTGFSNAIPVDTYISPCNISLAVAMSSGSEVQIEHTFDNVFDSSITPTWYVTTSSTADEGFLLQENGDAILQENGFFILTGDENFSFFVDFPISAVRLNTLQNGGVVKMTMLQAGGPNL